MRPLLFLSIILATTFPLSSLPPEIILSEPDGNISGHDYVDLGLPSGLLWATSNVGTSYHDGIGYYLAWGELDGRYDFSQDSYGYYLGQECKQDFSRDLYKNIGSDICGTEYDAASYYWGNGWRMPRKDEIAELFAYCDFNWSYDEWAFGYNFFGPNGNSIFFYIPQYGGFAGEEESYNEYFEAFYWSGNSAPYDTDNDYYSGPCAYAIVGDDIGFKLVDNLPKYEGGFIRPVIDPSYAGFTSVTPDSDIQVICKDGKISISGGNSSYKIELFNVSCAVIYSGSISPFDQIDTPVESGFYILRISDKDKTAHVQKIRI